MALKAEGFAFTVSTPGDSVRLASDKGREDFVEVRLDASSDPPQVIGRISQTRGSRRLDEERPIKPGSGPESIDADDLLGFVVTALEPWLAR